MDDRTLLVDFHSHAWPRLADAQENAIFLQRHTIWHTQPVRRARDGAEIEGQMLYDGTSGGRSNLLDVDFRYGDFGRAQWTFEDEDYYIQWMPDLMATMVMPPALTVHMMDNVGVDWGLLSRGHSYGRINDYIASAVREYPDRLIGSAQIDEWEAHEPAQQDELRRCVDELGLRALYFETEALFMTDYSTSFDGPELKGFWTVVAELGIPVLWDIRCVNRLSPADFAQQLFAFDRWAARWPEIPSVVTHGFNMAWFEHAQLSDLALSVLQRPNVYLELLFPVMMGRRWQYPFAEAVELIRQVADHCGTERLVWGSDMPGIQRVCTYRQSLDYLDGLSSCLSTEALTGIRGGNAARLLGLTVNAGEK